MTKPNWLGKIKRALMASLPDSVYVWIAKWSLMTLCIIQNQSARWQGIFTPWVYSPEGFDPAREAAYAIREFQDYLQDSGLTRDEIAGKVVLELGPGNNLSVAMLFLHAGATKVICADRFVSLMDSPRQLLIYRALERQVKEPILDRFVSETKEGLRFDRIEYLTNLSGERLQDKVPDASVDIVISRAVLEHVYDAPRVLTALDAVLVPGGVMIHEIDFRDHGIFSGQGLHPLTHLSFSRILWRVASNKIGAPNRALTGFFRDALKQKGYAVEIQRLLFVGEGDDARVARPFPLSSHEINASARKWVQSARPFLSQEFRPLSDAELSVAAIFVTARKPHAIQHAAPDALMGSSLGTQPTSENEAL